ncbi:hypothetical protein [Parapedobacter lycopersici]|uniref:hypothetical protein n=1 Tax=Parapedobacter lycopersici TaxID=1864939 RepID=UPI003340B552
MAKIILKGIVKRVLPVEFYGNDRSGRRQSVILFVPGYVDQFGEKKGQDEEWQLDLYNDKIEKMSLNTNLHEKKVEATVYLNSKKFQRKDDGSDMWAISANLHELKLHESNNQSAPTNQPANAS